MKKIILAFLLSFAFSLFMQGQVTDQNALAYRKATKENKKAPSYPGGIEEYYRFLNENLNMDIVGDTTMWKGSVSVFCFFDTSGKCIRFTREGSYTSQVNREFERVLKLMSDWIPGEFFKNGTWIKARVQVGFILILPYDLNNQGTAPVWFYN